MRPTEDPSAVEKGGMFLPELTARAWISHQACLFAQWDQGLHQPCSWGARVVFRIGTLLPWGSYKWGLVTTPSRRMGGFLVFLPLSSPRPILSPELLPETSDGNDPEPAI